MATYIIGDIHGCFSQLQALLKAIKFKPDCDQLWFTGDLINGGPQPVEVLRFIKSLEDNSICILGNHDLVLLGVAAGKIPDPNDRPIGFAPVLAAEDREELLNWLQARPLVHYTEKFKLLLVHAGLFPGWDVNQVVELAKEVEIVLATKAQQLYANMYNYQTNLWQDNLTGWSRVCCIINYMTRMRFCDAQGRLDFTVKSGISGALPGYMPWYKVPGRKTNKITVVFGHWAALHGHTGVANVIALDTGCVWGNCLTALRLDDRKLFSVACS